ncbi:MAG: glycosyltransferase [Komarekiella atlantica HA4396-MV6]|jgi:UDP:flavonoid glycosyltransferase YjiC (YdhE family)|nr:glycosyltransferase [Komarekiella atlantica HA4396-MV6]
MTSHKRVVLTAFGTLGDLYPAMVIALELQNRGHHVVIATTEGYRSKVEEIGIRFHALRPEIPPSMGAEWTSLLLDPFIDDQGLMDLFCSSQRQTYDDLIKAVQGADLLVSINCTVVVAPLVAQKTKMRWISCVVDPFYIAEDFLGITPFAWVNRAFVELMTFLVSFIASVLLIHKHISHLRAELGLPQVKRHTFFSDLFSPELVLALYSPVIAKRRSDYPANTQITGFTFDRELPNQELSPTLAEFLDSGSPPIVFTLGSSAVYAADAEKFYTQSVLAAQKLGYRAVLLVGDNTQNLPSNPLPKGIIAVNYAPHSEIFPRAALIVHQSGMGTTAQALLAGIPMLLVPYEYEQPDTAARLVRLGVGRMLKPKQYHADRVTIELNKLLTQPQYKVKALEVRNRIQSEKGVQTACDAIEKHLSLDCSTVEGATR